MHKFRCELFLFAGKHTNACAEAELEKELEYCINQYGNEFEDVELEEELEWYIDQYGNWNSMPHIEFEDVEITIQKLKTSIANKNVGDVVDVITFEKIFYDEAVYRVTFDLMPHKHLVDDIMNHLSQPDFYLDGLSRYGPDVVSYPPGKDSLEVAITLLGTIT